jgi:hypothetical protein
MIIADKINTIIENAKEEEVKDALDTRDDWKRGTYIFEIFSIVMSIGSLVLGSSANVFTDYTSYLNYSAIISQAISISCKGISSWCSKKYTEQASIVNGIIDSVKTGKYPTLSLIPDRQSRTNDVDEKV